MISSSIDSVWHQLFSGGPEFVNMAAEVAVLLFNVNNSVFVKEQLMSISLQKKTKGAINVYADCQSDVAFFIPKLPTSSQASTRSIFRCNCPVWLSCSWTWALPSSSSPLVITNARRSSSSSYSTIRKVCVMKRQLRVYITTNYEQSFFTATIKVDHVYKLSIQIFKLSQQQ